ncbi:hypothetical protein AV530_007418 [Patagioenas fasciata monilis]|uniref:Uncharacterized protein n=1 Tax=Patagioenas fasciata monilis TaxID=372326 RepID=A0A1V4JXW9_PATFA|nr:hypothetical protein AV530_007418 [Patagioenas fasciata monilis]
MSHRNPTAIAHQHSERPPEPLSTLIGTTEEMDVPPSSSDGAATSLGLKWSHFQRDWTFHPLRVDAGCLCFPTHSWIQAEKNVESRRDLHSWKKKRKPLGTNLVLLQKPTARCCPGLCTPSDAQIVVSCL